MTEQKHYVLSREDLILFLDFAERQLYWLDEQDLETRKRILRLDLKDQQEGWLYFDPEGLEDRSWRAGMVHLGSITHRRLKRVSPLMRQTRTYTRLEKLRVEICTRLDRHLRMMIA